ncbi:uncharacterized protein K489DRAFT_298486, partial [Dissoconium aciculare CBS 342.82]|uniref:Ada DNA repair metal-binding domain-containing protein n=1 Tax=Dissoconium aciculare CBS 342.82 TaxID=1314786 RepID=A0A6J3M993_9PEZI
SRWRAITHRDLNAHWSFIYGVTSTKIYCRPTCSARVARRANVKFFDDIPAARREGFRPCVRCKPDEQNFLGEREEVVIRTLALLQSHDGRDLMRNEGLSGLAKAVGVTTSYLCRAFKKTVGKSVGAYLTGFE